MKRKPKTYKKTARAMVDPHPEFVSLVGAGANMQPFLTIKSDGLGTVVQPEEHFVMTIRSLRTDSHDIARIVFKSAAFADEAQVTAWLQAGGIEGVEIAAIEDGFEVVNKAQEFIGEPKAVEQDGYTVYVGELKPVDVEAVEKAETTAAEVVAVQPVAKTETAKDAVTPEMAAEALAVHKGVYDMTELGSVLNTLKWIVKDAEYTNIPDEAVSAIKQAAQTLIDALAMLMVDSLNDLVDAFKDAPVAKTAEAPEIVAAPEAPAVEAAIEAPVTPAAPEAPAAPEIVAAPEIPAAPVVEPAEVAKTAPDGLSALAAAMTSLAASVEGIGTAVKEMGAKTEQSVGVLTQRVEELEGQRQTRKGADVEEASPGNSTASPTKPAVDEHQQRALRNAFGISCGQPSMG